MKLEIPKFKRCCFCIPLRYGLLVWGYIKLVTALILFLCLSLLIQTYMTFFYVYGMAVAPIILLEIVILLFIMLDIGMTIVFVIGGHQKSAKLMKIFYIYSIVLMSVMTALHVIFIIYDLSVGDKYYNRYHSSYRQREVMSYGAKVTTMAISAVTFLVIQAYVILLIRSEINKLQNSRNFAFTNNAAEAECTMQTKNIEPQNQINVQTHNHNTEDCEVGNDTIEVKETSNGEGTFTYNKF